MCLKRRRPLSRVWEAAFNALFEPWKSASYVPASGFTKLMRAEAEVVTGVRESSSRPKYRLLPRIHHDAAGLFACWHIG
jgi:hypothetical protein